MNKERENLRRSDIKEAETNRDVQLFRETSVHKAVEKTQFICVDMDAYNEQGGTMCVLDLGVKGCLLCVV